MSWYDVFSFTYDAQLEELYRPLRARAVAALGLSPRVLEPHGERA